MSLQFLFYLCVTIRLSYDAKGTPFCFIHTVTASYTFSADK